MPDATDDVALLDGRALCDPGPSGRERRFAEIGAAVARLAPDRRAAKAAERLSPLLAAPGLLRAAECACPETGYGRRNIYFCPHETLSVVVAVWPAGIVSPIHDHLTWCAYGVIRGTVEDIRYQPVAGSGPDAARATERVCHRAGAATYLPGAQGGIHRIRNPGAETAVTLHIYGGDARKTGPNVKTVYSPAGRSAGGRAEPEG